MLRGTISLLSARRATRLPNAFRAHLTQTTPLRSLAQRPFSNIQATSKPKRTTNFSFTFTSNASRALRTNPPQNILQRLRSSVRHFNSSRPRFNGKPTSSNVAAEFGSPEPTTLKGRLKKLSREYGWVVVGVYLALSVLDFPFCFLLVRTVGTDKVGEWEHYIVSGIKSLIPDMVRNKWREWRQAMRKAEIEMMGDDDISDAVEMATWGVEEANAANKRDASLATQLALAYAIHKSFIFVRVPLTAAVTPKVVKTLRSWGWDIGKRTTKEAKALKRASLPPKTKK